MNTWLVLLLLCIPELCQAAVKQLYINTALDLSREYPAADVKTGKISTGSSISLDQNPVFQGAFTITAGNINIDLSFERNNKGDADRLVTVELVKVSNGGSTLTDIGSDTRSIAIPGFGPNSSVLASFQIVTAVDINFAAGDFIRLRITHEADDNGQEDIRVHSFKNGISQIEMQTNTVINVDSIDVYANAYPDMSLFKSYQPGGTVYIRPTVSDPFGYADISSVDISVYDTASTLALNATVTLPVLVPADPGAVAIYEAPAYTIPAIEGVYLMEVTAHEGTEGVSHTLQQNLHAGNPALTVKKTSTTVSDPVNVSNPKAIPNSHIEYTVETINTGFGFADNNSVIISDPLPTGQATFYFGVPPSPAQFIDGSVSSGLSYNFIDLASTTDDIQFSNNGGATFITPTADPVTGYDTTVPKINYIEINPKGYFRGSDGTNHPGFSVRFTIKVD